MIPFVNDLTRLTALRLPHHPMPRTTPALMFAAMLLLAPSLAHAQADNPMSGCKLPLIVKEGADNAVIPGTSG